MQGERWMLKPKAKRSIEVVREIDDTSYADRARLPQELDYQPSSDTYGFLAAGRIHALMFMFQRKGERLQAWSYSRHNPAETYSWTGNTLWLDRCAR